MGIDENGLGASLGPLVVTAVVAEVSGRGGHSIDDWNSSAHDELLDDSKKLIRHGDVRLGEAWARVLTFESASNPRQLLRLISAVPVSRLMTRCPAHAQGQCWNDTRDEFLADDSLMARVKCVVQALRDLGIRPCHVLSRFVCTDELNARAQLLENRFLVDLHCMEELIVVAHERTEQPMGIVCGKVGGMHDYTRHFDRLRQSNPQIVNESKEVSLYRLADIGEVKFLRDADAMDPLVMLASLVGKYLRELFVSRIGDHFSELITNIKKPSGYHDPVTMEFVEATAKWRRKSAFPHSCFQRTGPRDT